MRATARDAVRVAGVAAAASLMLGCAAQAKDTTPRPPQAVVRPVGPQQTLEAAEDLLERDCMRRSGFGFWVAPPLTPGARREFPYVVDDVAWAKEHGYGSDRRAAVRRTADADPNTRYLRSLEPRRRAALVAALNGPRPTGLAVDLPNGARVSHSDQGCTAEAERRLYGDLPAWFRATRTTRFLTGERVAAVQQDARYRSARDRWAACMRADGLPYADPQESRAAADPERGADRAQEARVAVAEATCALSTDFSRIAADLDRSYETASRRRHPEVYADLARLTRAALPRARAVIARG
ncbi:hypothetical protein [Streptomyces candidus]|uniref:Secreted protein n=1 Tax=Streptomyces candidus TaxID=67283 RepID=A0A7X0HL70_9ACTN|nr:hypothetical protein [Streptomyces candidus]MBB6439535.1 hypothetical protein [Streptomyces candidus]